VHDPGAVPADGDRQEAGQLGQQRGVVDGRGGSAELGDDGVNG